jgi:hypothetical protein
MTLSGGYRGILVAVVMLSGAGVACGQINMTDSTLQTTLNVVQAQSNLNASIHVSASGLSDSDTDSSAISGTMDALLGLDFNSGNLGIKTLQFNGGDLNLVKNMHFDIDISFIVPIFSIDIDTVGLGGEPDTPSPSTISPIARPGTNGQFAASQHEVILNQGSINVTGDLNDTIALSSNPISGASNSATPGQVVIAQTAQDLGANTTTYSITITTPVGVQEVIEDSSSGISSTTTITGTGSVRAAVTDLVVNFIPWNGVFGDISQNGTVGSEDITAFVNGWRSTNSTPGRLAIQKGDLNFDGITDLHDAFLLRSALQGNNLGFSIGDLLAGTTTVPEPSTWILLAAGCTAVVARRRLAK